MLSPRHTARSLVSKSTYGTPMVIFRGPLVPMTFMWYCTTASSLRVPAPPSPAEAGRGAPEVAAAAATGSAARGARRGARSPAS